MKKTIFMLALVGCFFANAQSPIGKGGKQVNFGVALSTNGVPVYVSYDFGVHPDITITPQLATNLNGFNWLGIACKGDYHFNTLLEIPQNWDFYTGLKLGFNADINNDNDKDYHDGLDLGLQIGGRWYWSDWGINLEFGGGAGGFGSQFGLSKKL